MSKEAIVERILSDAGNEADAIVKDAEERSGGRRRRFARGGKGQAGFRGRVRAKTASISERAALPPVSIRQRYSCPKAPRHRRDLCRSARTADFFGRGGMSRADRSAFEGLRGGGRRVFAASYLYVPAAARLPVVTEKLKISAEKAAVRGGFVLRGTASDRTCLTKLCSRRTATEHQADIAAEFFRTR
ncbi:MAG: hypothetical protein ACLS4Z_06235 [Christensenellaceae bacterium]